jgi:hypothetical protein
MTYLSPYRQWLRTYITQVNMCNNNWENVSNHSKHKKKLKEQTHEIKYYETSEPASTKNSDETMQ